MTSTIEINKTKIIYPDILLDDSTQKKIEKTSSDPSTQAHIAKIKETFDNVNLWTDLTVTEGDDPELVRIANPEDTFQSVWGNRIFQIGDLTGEEKQKKLNQTYFASLLGHKQGKINAYDFANIAMHWAIQTQFPDSYVEELPITLEDLEPFSFSSTNDKEEFLSELTAKSWHNARKVVVQHSSSVPLPKMYSLLEEMGIHIFSQTTRERWVQFPPRFWVAVDEWTNPQNSIRMTFDLTQSPSNPAWVISLPSPKQKDPESDSLALMQHGFLKYAVANKIPHEDRLFLLACARKIGEKDTPSTRELQEKILKMDIPDFLKKAELCPKEMVANYLGFLIADYGLSHLDDCKMAAPLMDEIIEFGQENGYSSIHEHVIRHQESLFRDDPPLKC